MKIIVDKSIFCGIILFSTLCADVFLGDWKVEKKEISTLINDKTSDRIIEIATKLVKSEGAHNVTVRKVLKELGATNRVFYNRFRNIAEVLEIVAVAVGVEARIGELLARQGRHLPVLHVVLQELRHLLAAKVLSVAPRVDQDPQPEFVGLVDDLRNVRPPEVEVELRHGEDHLSDAMRLHLPEVGLGVLDVVESVVAYRCLCYHSC